jgi:hypothetical protein
VADADHLALKFVLPAVGEATIEGWGVLLIGHYCEDLVRIGAHEVQENEAKVGSKTKT